MRSSRCMVVVAERIGEERVVLSGGCFQNRYLIEHDGATLARGRLPPLLASAYTRRMMEGLRSVKSLPRAELDRRYERK